MPSRRKNTDLCRVKRLSKKGRLYEYLSSSYIQYILIVIIWAILLLINQSTEMRFEYFWPGWLFICSVHDSIKFQGLQYTMVFIIIVITMDSICLFLLPPSWIYSCGSAYVWIYLLWHTDQGLCFLTLTLCFIFVYFELGFYSREAKLNQSIYLFRPFAAHSIGYPVVCMGLSIKRYVDSRHKQFQKMDVRRKNVLYFRILREAIPYSALSDSLNGACTSIYLPDDVSDSFDWDCDGSTDGSGQPLPWSLFLLQQFGKSVVSQLHRWTSCSAFVAKECNGVSSPHACQTIQRHSAGNALTTNSSAYNCDGPLQPHGPMLPDGVVRRMTAGNHVDAGFTGNSSGPNNRRSTADTSSDAQAKSKQSGSHKQTGGRYVKEDLTTRLENSIRRLRSDVQSMRAVETQLRTQLTQLEREDRLNRLRLSEHRQKNESLSVEVNKLATQSRLERTALQGVEKSLLEEKQLRDALQSQLNVVASSPVESNVNVQNPLLTDHDPGIVVKFARPNSSPTEASCCQRRRALESDVFALRLALKRNEDQLHALSTSHHTPPQQQQPASRTFSLAPKRVGSMTTPGKEPRKSPRSDLSSATPESRADETSLERQVQNAVLEAERLNNTLRQENWMKQDLLTSYHNSVREINDLNKTHKQRDFQILELTMKIEQLECLVMSRGDRTFSGRPKRDLMPARKNGNGQATSRSRSGTDEVPTSDLSSLVSLMSSPLPTSNVSWNATSHSYGPRAVDRFPSEADHSNFRPPFSSPEFTNFSAKGPKIATTGATAQPVAPFSVNSDGGVDHLTTSREYDTAATSQSHVFSSDNSCSDLVAAGYTRSGPMGCVARISTETH